MGNGIRNQAAGTTRSGVRKLRTGTRRTGKMMPITQECFQWAGGFATSIYMISYDFIRIHEHVQHAACSNGYQARMYAMQTLANHINRASVEAVAGGQTVATITQ